jgi:hypothetical protein
MRKVSDHRWETRARGPVSLAPVGSVNAVKRWEEGDVRLRSVRSKMPIVCKALEIERWRWRRGTRKPGLLYVARDNNPHTSRSISIPRKSGECMILLLRCENVHHSNEPHNLGNTSESRVDTEVQNYAVHH